MSSCKHSLPSYFFTQAGLYDIYPSIFHHHGTKHLGRIRQFPIPSDYVQEILLLLVPPVLQFFEGCYPILVHHPLNDADHFLELTKSMTTFGRLHSCSQCNWACSHSRCAAATAASHFAFARAFFSSSTAPAMQTGQSIFRIEPL